MINKTLNTILLLLSLIAYGCAHDHHDHETEEHEHSSNSVTQFNSNTEIFMEYPQLAVGVEAEFLIHLNDLKVFKPVTEGTLEIEFVNNSGNKVISNLDMPARAGIFIPKIKFDNPGAYTMTITLKSSQVSDIFSINNVIVYASEKDIPHLHDEASNLISFLKEQQWKIDFATEAVSKRALQLSVPVTGEIISKPELFSKVVSPVAGLLLHQNNSNFPKLGTYVKKGTALFNISPSADASTSIQKIKTDYLLAKSEYERVQNLFDKKAVAKKRLDESRFDFESKQAVYNSLLDQIIFTDNGYSIVAPIDGYIENISVNLGSQISSGQELITIVNPSRLILKANVPAAKFEDANNAKDASFRIEGHQKELRISQLNGRKISVASSLNTQNRTVPVYFEFSNPQNQIKVGMYAEVFIKNGFISEAVSIPESAIIDEDGMHTVYVEIEGEGFEKRIIKTGITDTGYVQVVEGLKEGERVVTKGAYQVRLAALSPESAIGHGHVH
ncbi:MAG: RND family efflux transporter MFP subunit [Ignavibacteria bacterium]|nr:MAG: RND family efflux transporter MFP subunit [Ignavibacteria bacterium]KAF0161096.1 MAG: RND family efflux transporter MFP subunit [Ignavibacteria bacterium]